MGSIKTAEAEATAILLCYHTTKDDESLADLDPESIDVGQIREKSDKNIAKVKELTIEEFAKKLKEVAPQSSLSRLEKGEGQSAKEIKDNQKLDLLYRTYISKHKRVKTDNMATEIESSIQQQAQDLMITSRNPTAHDLSPDYCVRGYMYGAALMFADTFYE